MDVYEIHVDLKPGVSDMDFAAAVDGYLGSLADEELIAGWRLLRRKLGFGSGGGEFKLLIEVRDLAQLDAAFQEVSTRAEPFEGLHHGVNSLVTTLPASLSRDCPHPPRVRGQERI